MRNSLAAFGLTAILVVPTTAGAAPAPPDPDDFCAPQARGVPFLSPTTPNWWSPPDSFEEERWTGASRHDWSKGADGASWMRVLWDKTPRTLFFEFSFLHDDNPDPGLDHVVLGFQMPTGERIAIVLDPTEECPTGPTDLCNIDQAIDPSHVLFAERPAGPTSVWTALDSTPVGGWQVQDPWINATDAPGGGGPFSYRVKLKLVVPAALVAGDGEVVDNLLVYTARLMGIDHDNNPGTADQVIQFPWPRCIGPICNDASWEVTNADTEAQIPAGIPFNNAAVLKTGAKSNCDFGVLLNRMDLGTDFPAFLGSQIRKSTTQATLFRAQVQNNMDVTVEAGSVEADFFVANWGVGGAGATWTKLNPTPVALSANLAPGAIADGTGPTPALLQTSWTPTSLPSWDHQCVRVQLSTPEPNGPTPPSHEIEFVQDSVYRNMNFVTASVHRQPAEISVKGIGAPLDGDKHQVLLRVRTETMPDPQACAEAKKAQKRLDGCDNGNGGRHFTLLEGDARAAKLACIERWKREQAGNGEPTDRVEKNAPAQDEPPGDDDDATAPDGFPCGEGQTEAQGLPTIIVDAYVTVADAVNSVGHKQVPILRHLGGFGHYVMHEGPIAGWETGLHGAKPLGQGQYVLEIPEDGVKTIHTTIRALDPETPSCADDPKAEGCDDPNAPGNDPPTTTTTTGPGDGGGPTQGCCSRCSAHQSPGETVLFLIGGLFGLAFLRRRLVDRPR